MTVTFFSNYLTHHQIPFCNAMAEKDDVEFYFVSTMPMETERSNGGWAFACEYGYELKAYVSEENENKAMELARTSDVVIIGSAPEKYIKHRMSCGLSKLTLRYSERIYKGGYWRALSPRGLILRFNTYFRYFNKPLYMLCASAYTAGDLAILGSYLGRCYKWGYFPETKNYENIDNIISKKNPTSLLWVARLIDWKHPEIAVDVAERLKNDGFSFVLNIIGNGEMEADLKKMIKEKDLQNYVNLLGSMSPDEVRKYMETSQIFLFTSDRNEGWGAVLNEAMNSGCCVVASQEIGSAPFLIENGKNAYTYKNKEELYQKVTQLLSSPEQCGKMGIEAYNTITKMWNARAAANRLLEVCQNLLKGKKIFFNDGVCSKAEIKIGKG